MKVVRESMKEYNVHLMHEILIIPNFPRYAFFFFFLSTRAPLHISAIS